MAAISNGHCADKLLIHNDYYKNILFSSKFVEQIRKTAIKINNMAIISDGLRNIRPR
ncbi:hypothetical protein l11_11310 [Neisseria weaveri LMG 5135]|nr:hypothetical protein l11_11310 [Neisseria weaveri LMG 5135]